MYEIAEIGFFALFYVIQTHFILAAFHVGSRFRAWWFDFADNDQSRRCGTWHHAPRLGTENMQYITL